jgi:hypothetical protein
LWLGQSRQGLMFRSTDVIAVPFSLLWGGFAIFWEWIVLNANAPWFFALWGIPFVLVGLYMIAGRFFFDARRRARTHYALTSERVMIAGGPGRGSVQSINLRALSDMSLTEGRDGYGTISFGSAPWPSNWFNGFGLMPGMRNNILPQLDTIPDAPRVYQMIRDAQERA